MSRPRKITQFLVDSGNEYVVADDGTAWWRSIETDPDSAKGWHQIPALPDAEVNS